MFQSGPVYCSEPLADRSTVAPKSRFRLPRRGPGRAGKRQEDRQRFAPNGWREGLDKEEEEEEDNTFGFTHRHAVRSAQRSEGEWRCVSTATPTW